MDPTDIDDVGPALWKGEDAAQAVTEGVVPDLDALDTFAWALDALRVGIANGTMDAGWVRPTEADVEAARELALRARAGAPSEELRPLALRAYRAMADPVALYGLCGALATLENEGSDPDDVRRVPVKLERALAFFERGGEVEGFSPTSEDVACLQRLRAIAFDSAAASERMALVEALWERMPKDDIAKIARGRT